MFNTRELAYLFWGTIVFILLLLSKSSRGSIINLIRTLFCRQFIIIYLVALTYIISCVLLLRNLGVWESSLIKDTIIWTLFIAWPLMYEAAQINSFTKFISEIIRPLIAYSIVFEYIFSLYTFSLWIELLMIPALVLIGWTLAYSERKAEYKQVHQLVNGWFKLIGITAAISVVIHLLYHYSDYLNLQIFLKFIIPLLLSLLFLPLLYAISMLIHYEIAFVVLKRHFRDQSVYRYAMLIAMIRFNGDLPGMERWRNLILTKNLQSNEEIKQALDLIKSLQKAEKDSYTVNEGLGWSPFKIKDILVDKGLKTGDYNNTFDNEFCSISFPHRLNENNIFSDSITYMILGEQLVATELQLGLKVHTGNDSALSLFELMNCSEILYEGVFGEQLPKEIKKAILKSESYNTSNSLAKLFVKKELWLNRSMGYSLDFTISHFRHNTDIQ